MNTEKAKRIFKIITGIHLNSHDYICLGYYISENPKKHSLWYKLIKSLIGKNLTLGHPFNITVNPRVTIGDDCVHCKGCTIGSVRSGPRMGVPQLGDRVVVGINSFVCGNITIGNDVLIAANSFVDFDVPDNSLVLGNPGVIHKKLSASKDYINVR